MKRRKRIIIEDNNSEPKPPTKKRRRKKISLVGKRGTVKATVDPRYTGPTSKKMKKKGPGRESKRYQPLDPILTATNCLAVGLTQKRACLVIGVDEKTFIQWKKEDDDLKRQVEGALPRSIFGLAAKVHALCNSKSETIQLAALKWLLPKLAPEEFMDTTRQHIHAQVSEYEGETPDPAFL